MTISEFKLHPQLKKDCVIIGDFDLNLVLLMNDKQYPWFILLPKRTAMKEIHELTGTDQQQFIKESSIFSKAIHEIFAADKINVAALGNMVPQLHIHHIVRYETDSAWPAPIWGVKPSLAYQVGEVKAIITKLQTASIAGLVLRA